MAGSVAALDDVQVMGELTLDPQRRTAQTLAPGIQQVLRQAGWKPGDVELTTTAVGPGSFTGLRVGVATAKTFAYAVGSAVLGVDALEACANQAPAEAESFWGVMDAYRSEVFTAHFRRTADGRWSAVETTHLAKVETWLSRLAAGDWIGGPMAERLAPRLPDFVRRLKVERQEPTAVEIGRLAFREWSAGRRDDVWGLAPKYYRLSAAEEKRAALDGVG